MKIWMKIFLCSFLIFESVFNIGGIILIEYGFNQSLKREINSGLNEQLTMHSGLQTTGDVFAQNYKFDNGFFKEFLGIYFQNYMDYYANNNVYAEIREMNNTVVYSSFEVNDLKDREELNTTHIMERKYIIRDIEDSSYLFATSLLKIGTDDYKFTYIQNITEIYTSRKLQYKVFTIINIILGICIGISLYVVLRYMTKPIRMLIKSTELISSGYYSERVDIITTDEVGELSESFNHMAESIEEKIEALNKNTIAKQDFIQSLTHEMKTPLTSIIGYAELLRDTKYNEINNIKGMNYIYSEAKRLERLSLKLMDLILLDEKIINLKEEDIKSVYMEIDELIMTKVGEKNLDFKLDIKPFKVIIEKDLFKVLIINLVDNAIKASSYGGVLTTKFYKDKENKFIFTVEDNGIGIEEDDIERIFEPFYMVDKSRTKSNNGAGLGLSICTKIIDLHGGKIDIESKVGKGTKILVKFS